MNIQDEESDLLKKCKERLIKFRQESRGGVQSRCRRVTGLYTGQEFLRHIRADITLLLGARFCPRLTPHESFNAEGPPQNVRGAR